MKPHTQSARATAPNRRAFLKGLGVLGAGSLLGSQPAIADSDRHSPRFQLFAKGIITDFSLVWPVPPIPPLDEGLVVSVRVEFPIRRNILAFHSFVALEAALDDPLMTVSLFHMRVDNIGLSRTPVPNFGLFGQIIYNPILNDNNHSPWGDLTGRISTTYGEFDASGDHTTFTLFGGAAAGSHASALRTATGSLHIKGPWHSF